MKDIFKIMYREFKAIGSNIPILIVLVLGNVGYGFLYNLMYDTNVYHDAPIAVVDMSQSHLSQHFTDYINSTQQVEVVAVTQNFEEAKQMLTKREIVGFLYIPSELEEEIMKGNQVQCTIYGSTLSFLDYLNISEAVNFASLQINSELLPEMIKHLNMVDVLFLANGKAVNIVSEALYNSSEGYGTYLIPPVMVIIIFQTMMITMAMRCGDENVRIKGICERKTTRVSMTSSAKTVFGKAFTNVIIYIVFAVFFLGLLPMIFDLPHLGDPLYIIIMMIPYLFASAFFCLCLSPFFTDGEMPLFIIVFMSVPLVFLTGISYPLELMPWHWKIFHYLIPVGPATMAFVKIDCMGAALTNIKPEMVNLWLQCIVYFSIAVIVRKRKLSSSAA